MKQTGKSLPVITSDETSKGEPVKRRDFVLLVLGWIGTLGSLCAAGVASLRGLVPNLLDEPNLRYRAGKPEDYLDGADTFVEDIRVFIQRKGNGYRALSAICTHLGCTVNPNTETGTGFRCPCHGSVFDEDGRVLRGPAPKPLACYALTTARDGRLVVDRDRPVTPDRYLLLEPPATGDQDRQA